MSVSPAPHQGRYPPQGPPPTHGSPPPYNPEYNQPYHEYDYSRHPNQPPHQQQPPYQQSPPLQLPPPRQQSPHPQQQPPPSRQQSPNKQQQQPSQQSPKKNQKSPKKKQQDPRQQQPPRETPPAAKGIPRGRRPRGAPPGVGVSLCVKYTIFFLNLLFWILGAVLLGFGIWGLVSKSLSSIDDIASEAGFNMDPMVGFIVVGGIIFTLGLCGCIGALRENTFILKIFTYSLILIFLAEIVIGVLGYIYSDKLIEILEVVMIRYIDDYFEDPDTQFIVDGMQKGLKCCGSVGPLDWAENRYFACDSPAKSACSVPFSCCLPEPDGIDNYQCGYGVLAEPTLKWREYIHTTGCVDALQSWFIDYAIILGCVGGALIILQCVTICLGKSLIADIEVVKSYW